MDTHPWPKRITESRLRSAIRPARKKNLSKGGSDRWVRWIGHGLFDDQGPFIEYQAIGLDITKEKNAEIERRTAEELQRRNQKLEAIGTLSAGIAHDFNNILAVLLGNVQLAMDDVLEGSRSRNNLNEIYDACLRARDMVQQILTFCRKREEEFMPLDLTPVVKESIKFLRSTIPSTIEIRENLHGVCLANSDPTQLSQILMNLGTNASHAMGGRPGVLEISMATVAIDHAHEDRCHVRDEGKYVKLSVTDTGCGMPPEVISRVFDPYFTTKEEGVGSGMGLAVVHGIIESHNGVIWVESDIGKGSTFHILFPVAETGNPSKINLPVPAFRGDERILLVDDQENVLKVEAEILRRLGYRVIATTDPIEALEIFRKQPDEFDLVYTDLTMPFMTGLTLSKKLLEIRPKLPVILYTGLGSHFDLDKIGKIGISALLKKPVLLEDLASTIRKVLKNENRNAVTTETIPEKNPHRGFGSNLVAAVE